MKKAKKLLALFLAVMMLFSGMSVGLGGIAVFAATNVTVDGVVDKTYTSTDDVIICVPETIYMTPSIGASVSGQYFVNNNVDENGKVTLATDRAHTTGQISFYAPGATAFSFNVTAVNGGIGDPVMGGSATDANASFEVTTWQNTDLGGTTGYLSVDALNLFINGTGLTAGNTALIKWAITLYYGANDTTGVTYYAYSTLYSPYYYPIGAATRAKTNSKAFAQSIAWVSGVHGFTPNADDSKYWVAVTNETLGNEAQDVTERGTYYVKTSSQAMVPLIYGVGDSGKTTSAVKDWLSTSAPGGGITVPTIRYFSLDNKSTNGGVMVVDISPVANLTVDTSRYNNLNQIPNFTVGYNVTDTDGADKVYWYVSDYTSVAHSVTAANNGTTNFFNWTKSTGKDDIDDYEPQWFNGTSAGSIIYGSATSEVAYSSGVEYYNQAWNRPLVTGSDHYDYMFKGAQHTYNGNRAYSINYVQLRVNNVDKSDLRSLVLKATSLNEQIYTTETWTPFISALQTAAQALGNPTNTSVDTAALKNAMDALKLKEYDLVFDNLIDFNQWDTLTASNNNGTINNRTDVGFTLTSNDGAGEATSLSPFFPVTPGKQYKIDIDITGNAWDVYIFFCDETDAWVDFVDGPNGRYSSPAFPGMHEDHVFTAPDKDTVVKAQIRVDANGSNNAVTFKNIRVSEVGTVADGVSYVVPMTVTHGSTCSSLPTPTRPGYDFAGWAYADGTAVTASDKITANTNLYSTWTPATYTITFLDANGATYATDAYTLADTTITLPATNPTKTAYSFAGWVVDTAAGNWTSGDTVTAAVASKYGNITVKPVWTPSNYDITFNTDGGSAVANVSYNIERTFTLPTTTKTAYDFAGWKVQTADGNWSADTTYQAGSQSGKYGNVTLVAQWNPTAYTITYDANGGDAIAAVGYTIKDTVALPTPVKTGYTFAGWKVTSGTAGSWTAGTYNAGNVSSMYGDVTLQAQWTAIPYTITFVNWDDSVLQNTKFDYGTTPVAPADPTRADDNGYTYAFKGWEPTVSTVTGEATYKATYTATLIPYTITLDAGEGSVSSSSVAYNYESTSVTLPEPTRLGYTFTGWTVKETAGSWTEGAAVNGTLSNAWGNVTLVANYTANEYTITIDLNDDNYIGTGANSDYFEYTVKYGEAVEDFISDSDVSRAGYTFAGWYTVAKDGTDADKFDATAAYTTADDITIYAYWTPVEYTLTLYNCNSEGQYEAGAQSTMTYTIETNLKLPCPERTGYDFDRWATGISAKGSWTKETNYTDCNMGTGNYGDATLTLYYTPKTYTIKWYNGSTLLETDENVPYDSMPSYDGETPTQTPTETYAYEFTGWTPEVSAVTKDETYIATFKEVDRIYTVKFVDWDGSVISEQALTYNATPEKPADPTREATAQYTYAFSTWKDALGNDYNEILPVTADVTYTADYTATLRSYTITWVVDGVETTATYDYGATPDYGSTPTKEADAQYTYTFTSWSPVIEEVTGDATYTAQFSNTTNTYTVTWKNADGSVLETDEDVAYGATPSYDGETPTKAADAQYTYTWSGWDPAVDTVTGDVTYTATYTTTTNTYTVTFVDEDGETVLEKDENVPYGTTPSYDGATPTKAATAEWTYTFAGWTPEITTVTGDVTYKADYTATKNSYTITFVDDDGTEIQSGKVPYGTTPTLPANPTKASTAQYSYEFASWSPAVVAVTGDATYTATYTATVNKYTVTWYNYDGSVIETDENVEYGTAPSYDGVTPEKPTDGQNIYGFSGWGASVDGTVYNSLPTVSGDMNFYAIFVSSDAKFTITWANYDGTVLEIDEDISYGEEPIFDGENPTRAEDAQYIYTFDGWTPDVTTAKANVTYTAKYSTETKKYTITFVNEDGTTLQSTEVEYGTVPAYNGATPTKTGDAQYSYTFAGWDKDIVSVTGEATYKATYTQSVNKYTITFVNEDGSELQKSEWDYGSTPVYSGETPTKAATAQYTYTFKDWGTIKEVTEDATYTATYTSEINKYIITFVNEDGTELQKSEWDYGSTPVYSGATPTKAATAQYTYTWSGSWNKDIVSVTEDATYTATFNSTVNKYTIKFVNEDGTELQSSKVEYGATPSYTGATPTKAETDQYTYTWSGWTPAITSVTDDATYTATYTETVRSYTITWLDDAGNQIDTTTVEYGQTPTHADPTKASTAQYDYTFAGWTPEVVAVTGDKSYTATYTEKVRSYTITWLDDAGNEIDTTTVEYGQTPTHADPTKASTAQYDYTFTGWAPEVVAVTGTATYKAEFDATVRSYTITWVVGDTTTTTTVKYGDTPAYDGTPALAPTAEREYTFTSWSPAITTVTGEKTYTAQFSEKLRSYTITYVVDGVEFDTKTVEFGANFDHPAIPEKEGYSSYWNVGYMTMPAQDITVNAVYTAKKYTVTWVADGQNVYEEQVAFGSSIPAKTVPAKVGHSGVWTNVPATMPAENVTITAKYSPETYNVTWTFTTSSGSDIATYNETWSTTFTGYVPLDVRITINGNVLSTDSYTYNADTGYLQIKGDAITGNISITEKAVDGYMNVVISAVNATHTNNVSIVKEGEAFYTQIVPNEGYLLPERVTVCINGVQIYNGYSYDPITGRLTINADVMYGELSIRFESPVDNDYDSIVNHACACSCHSSSIFVKFFWQIINFFHRIFGMTQYRYCNCGVAHW